MSERKSTLSAGKKLLFAAITTLGFFGLLELALATLGVERITNKSDPMSGFSRQIPLLANDVRSDGEPMLRTADQKLVWFNPQSFPLKKPAGTRRVFCVGGSTTFGRPFHDSTSYVAWLRELLPRVDPSCQWEVINAGGVSYASYRVAAVMEELATCDPDLFIVYSAQNEFLERLTYGDMFEKSQLRRDMVATLQSTRTWALIERVAKQVTGGSAASTDDTSAADTPADNMRAAEEVDELLNHSIGPTNYHRDDAWQADVVQHYGVNLKRMIEIAHGCGAKIVFVSPASNLRDCWPFKSEQTASLDEADVDDAEDQLKQIYERLRASDAQSALPLCESLIARDPRHAEAQFLTGRTLFALRRYEEAEVCFQRAIDEDVCPLRATTPIQQTMRRVAEASKVPWVAFDQRLRERSIKEFGHACFGKEYFLDHVHPTLDVHRDLGLWIIGTLQDASLVQGRPPTQETIDAVQVSIDSTIDRRMQGVAFRNLAKVLHWAGKFHEAAPRARDAIRLLPTDLESRFLLADCLFNLGQYQESREQYQQLFTIADYPRAYLPYGELLAMVGDLTVAESYLTAALATRNLEHQARAHYLLGFVYLELGDFERSIESLKIGLEIYPDDRATQQLLEEVLQRKQP